MRRFVIILSLSCFSLAAVAQTKEKSKPCDRCPKVSQQDTAAAAKPEPQKKTVTVELLPEAWNIILAVIDQSNAPHTQVTLAQSILLQQLGPQLQKLREQQKESNPKN